MVRRNLFLTLALAAVLALPVLAGDHGKCKASTQDCLNKMAAKLKSSGFVGVELDKNEETGALTVTRVVPGSPAEDAGIKTGDQLYALNGVVIADENYENGKLDKARQEWSPGQDVTYTIKRGGYDKEVQLTLAPMPADVMAAWIGNHMLDHASASVAAK
jgi:C-terminal processing protease CtpA/Prc